MAVNDEQLNVVALVPAKDRGDTVAATVAALRAMPEVARVLVVDDGSTDATLDMARHAGAEVLRLPVNVGKGGAVAAGIAAAPEADVYLLVDADVGDTAAAARALLGPVLSGGADMTIAELPAAGRRGGFGSVKRLAAAGIRRASGHRTGSPLSGQRAVRGALLRSLPLAPRFGLETGLTIDAVRAGARVVEVPVAMEHRHTGRRLAGFRHRARQGVDIARALWPRLTTARQRVAGIAVLLVVALVAMLWSGNQWEASSEPAAARPGKVVLFGMPHLGFADLDSGDVPHLDRLRAGGAVAAMSVRTLSGRPTTAEGYATLGAGTRVRARNDAARAYPAGADLELATAREAMARRTGKPVTGDIVVLGYPATVRLISGKHLSSEPGALGDALHRAGLRTGAVGNADAPAVDAVGAPEPHRPAPIALVDRSGSVDTGNVSPEDLLAADPAAPFGVRFDEDDVMAATRAAVARADVVLVDPGDLDRAFLARPHSLDRAADAARRDALRRTDALLGRMVRELPPDTLLMVVSVSPPSGGWRLTPMVVAGPGVPHGYVMSPSVKRLGVVTVTDVAPTVLRAFGADVPDGMIGHAFRYHEAPPDLEYLRRLDRDADYREGIYFPITVVYIVVQALLYLLAMLLLSRHRTTEGVEGFLRWAVVAVAAFPLATFVFRAVPEVAELGDAGVVVLVAIDFLIATLAVRARRHPLSPLAWVVWATALLIVVDVATGARLQYSSLLGYSLHTAARFTGLGNTAFAALAATAIIAACIHVAYSPRRREALLLATGFLAVVVVADGAPSLGNDVGGILTLVPVFGLVAVALTGRRVSWRTVALAAGAAAVLLAVATGVDLLRPADDRTHLGRFVTDLIDGNDTSTTTIARKAATNVRVFGASIWTWMVPIIAVFALFLLVFERRASELLPRGSALRAGVVGTLAAGLLGFAVNDSGVVVTAIVFVYIGPYLTLLALRANRGDPVLYAPLGSGAPGERVAGVGAPR